MNAWLVAQRVHDTLRRDAAVSAAARAIEVASRAKPDYGNAFPLVRVAPSPQPVHRRPLGTGTGPDRHPPQEATAAIEVVVISSVQATNDRAQEEAWRVAGLVEGALARNARLTDADGANALCHTLELSTVRRVGRLLGQDREGLTVVVMAKAMEDVGALPISGGGGGQA